MSSSNQAAGQLPDNYEVNNLVHDEKLKAVGTLYAGLAHEINNPLNFAVLGVELLKNEGRAMMSDEYASTIADIETGLQRISNIINDLRMLAHKDQFITRLESFLIGDAVTSAIRVTSEHVNNNVQITSTLDTPYRVKGGASSIVQVLVNLINNAAESIEEKWRGPGGRINIYGKVYKARYIVEVVDNGVGLSNNQIKTLFTPFHSTKATGSGVGLGLSISQSIIKQHGGQIKIDSMLGEWASLSFDLELAAD